MCLLAFLTKHVSFALFLSLESASRRRHRAAASINADESAMRRTRRFEEEENEDDDLMINENDLLNDINEWQDNNNNRTPPPLPLLDSPATFDIQAEQQEDENRQISPVRVARQSKKRRETFSEVTVDKDIFLPEEMLTEWRFNRSAITQKKFGINSNNFDLQAAQPVNGHNR